jgi:hypothetical protein
MQDNEAVKVFVCSTCNDTHRMPFGGEEVMCTRCPVPCQKCRAGAFCEATPCGCACHVAKVKAARPDFAAIRRRAEAAEKGPWFFNSYSSIFSHPLSAEYMQLELALDEKLKSEGRESVDADFDAFPDSIVASVRVVGGDTATTQGYRDADFIAHARTDVPDLLDEVARLTRERIELAELLHRIVKYAEEDRAQAPGLTRLARVLAEANALLGTEVKP